MLYLLVTFGTNQVLRGVDLKVEKGDHGHMDFDDIHTELKGASKAVINKVRKKTALENVMEGLVIARKAPKKEAVPNIYSPIPRRREHRSFCIVFCRITIM